MGAPFAWLENWGESPVTDTPLRVIGIDLGTTISTVTEILWTPGSNVPPLVQMKEVPQAEFPVGEKIFELVPSVVALLNGKEYIGWGAHNIRARQDANPQEGKNVWAETKNFIGTRKRHAGAPEGYETPRDIAAKVLKFLYDAVLEDDATPINRVVITVPASFQLTQRKDTVEAATAAGIPVQPGDLLDEPVAAFLDFVNLHPEILTNKGANQRMMVVDFGGGTTDIALLHIKRHPDGRIQVFRKGVSRFHRIGGSDLDRVIAHDVLLRDLMEQNDLKPLDLTYRVKSKVVLPILTGTAEALKKNLSNLVNNRIAMGAFTENDESLKVSLPAPIKIQTGLPELGNNGELTLSQPTLTLKDLDKAVAPFLRLRAHQPVENEYINVNSIFAPIKDVLRRADWTPEHVDAVLIVGGSSVFYGVERAIREYLPGSVIYSYADKLDMQRCVGRGAASQALLLAAYGKSPLEMAMAEDLTIQTQTGPMELVKANASLPFPGYGEYKEITGLRIQKGSGDAAVPLDFQILSGGKELHSSTVLFEAPVQDGTQFSILLNVDSNMNAHFKIELHGARPQTKDAYIENPFSVVANPNEDRDKIMEIEERLISGELTESQKYTLILELADLHQKLGQYQKSRHFLESLLPTASNQQKGGLLFRLGYLADLMRDIESKVAFYRESFVLTGDRNAAFSLAVALKNQGHNEEALEILKTIFELGKQNGAVYSLRSTLNDLVGHKQQARDDAQKCIDSYPDLHRLEAYELYWLRSAAVYLGYQDLIAKIDDQAKANQRSDDEPSSPRAETFNRLPVQD